MGVGATVCVGARGGSCLSLYLHHLIPGMIAWGQTEAGEGYRLVSTRLGKYSGSIYAAHTAGQLNLICTAKVLHMCFTCLACLYCHVSVTKTDVSLVKLNHAFRLCVTVPYANIKASECKKSTARKSASSWPSPGPSLLGGVLSYR